MKHLSFLLLLVSCIACTKSKDKSYVICGHVSDTTGIAFSNTDFMVTIGNYSSAPTSGILAEFTTDSSGNFCFTIDEAKTKEGICLLNVFLIKPLILYSGRIDLPATPGDTIKLGNRTMKLYHFEF